MEIWVVEIETGSSYEGDAMLFDSAWKTKEAAQEYAKKFKGVGGLSQDWKYDITRVIVRE